MEDIFLLPVFCGNTHLTATVIVHQVNIYSAKQLHFQFDKFQATEEMATVKVLVLFGFFIPATTSLNAGLKEAIVCEGKKSTISCNAGYTISIEQANYGRYDTKSCTNWNIFTTRCFSSSSTGTIKASCNDRRSCSLFASNSVFGDPCWGTYKYIRVLYKCRKSLYNRIVICEHSSRTIKCPSGLVISINSASYGRQEKNTCPGLWTGSTSCSARAANNIVKGKCHYKNSCWLHASNLIYGDPCFGTLKYLSVSYRCMKPRHEEAIACEGRSRKITCPLGRRISIHSANYGRTDMGTCPSSSIKSIRCYAQHSKLKVAASCNGKRSCTLRPFNSVFGDPCGGTYKYLRVHYDCI